MADLDFDTFLQWEIEARRAADGEVPDVTTAGARGEWLLKQRKEEYIEALEMLQGSLDDADECNANIYNLPKSVPSESQTALKHLRRREGTLQAMIEAVRGVYENLQRLQQEQTERDNNGNIIANAWTRQYTAKMITGILGDIRIAREETHLCRMARTERGSRGSEVEPLYPSSEDVDDTLGVPGTQGSDWAFIRELGKGACGQVLLWCRKDNNGNIIEKIATKDSKLPPEHVMAFYDDGSEKKLREPYMHALLSAQDPTGRHTVLYRGEHTSETKHRMYLEFCAYGDLWDVMERLHARGPSKDHISKPAVPAVWALLESLVKAQWLMTYGVFPGANQLYHWSRMLHRDIKPENVMLSTPAENAWAGLPTMKLGDFGYAGLESEPSFQTTSCGTPLYCAPEVSCARWEGLPEGATISTPADIWSIGATMAEFMNSGDRHQASRPYRYDVPKSEPPKIGSAARAFYPKTLIQLVERCLQRLPAHRIGLHELRLHLSFEADRLSQRILSEEDRMRFPLTKETDTIVRLDL